MARGATVKQEHEDGLAGGEQKANKRRCVQSACGPCRKRKSKCDGGTPVCATCTAVYKTPCFYDAESENRRGKTIATKREGSISSVQPASPLSDNAEFLLSSIRSLPEHEVYELVQQIRKDVRLDIPALADSWRRTVTFPPSTSTPTEPHSLEADLSMLLGKPAMTQSGESRYFGHTSALSLIPEDENYTPSRIRAASVDQRNPTWTAVTQDFAFVERLLDLYFRWSHTFYVIFSRECFYRDFRSGREKYCSPLLLNAILSYACHFSDEPAGRTDPTNFRTAGDHFFAEARRLLYEDESPSLTTAQALCVMAMREPSAGRDSSGFMYIGRCMRMVIELGLHLNNSAAPAMHLSPSEIEVRKVTFWGCFTVDTVWSICVGRISQLPRAAITLDKPILDEPAAGSKPDAYPGASHKPSGTLTNRVFLQEFSTLSELINDNNYTFFAPKERFTSRRLLDCYTKYQDWYKNLPQILRVEDVKEPQPHIIVLHMLYYTSIVHLFRPMLKVDLIHSHVRPRDACLDASNQVADLLRLYRAHYSLRACHLVLTHILLSVNIVHLLYSKESEESYRNMVEGLTALEDISTCHYFGKRGFKIIHALSKMWNLPFPEEVGNRTVTSKAGSSQVLLSPQSDSFFIGSHTSAIDSRMGGGVGFGSMASAVPSSRRESLSMFAHPDPKTTQMPPNPAILSSSASSSVSSQTNASQLHHHAPQPQPQQRIVSTHPPASSSTLQTQPSAPPSTATANMAADTIFWGPPGIGMPIVPRNYQMSPMDLDSMLGNANEWDRLSRDGFKMSDQWQQDPMTPFGGGAGGPGPGHHPHPHHTEDYGHHHHHQQQHHHHGGPAGTGGTPHEFHPGQDSVPFVAQELGQPGVPQQQSDQGHAHQHHPNHTQQQHGFDAAGWWGEAGPTGPLS